MAKLKELVIKTYFKDIWDVLIENYNDTVENHDQYNNVFKKLLVLEGAENIENIVIMIEKNESDSEEVFYNVCGIKKMNEVVDRYNISYTTWDKWLGYDVAYDTIAKYTPTEIVAHCIWEMTWNGFTEERLQERIQNLEWHINESAKVDNFKQSIADNGGMISDSDLHKIIDSYNNDHSDYIECLLLDIIKKDMVTPQQLKYIMKCINLKEFDKQAYIFEARRKIKDGVVLDRDVILKLINFKAFDFIDKALDSNSVSKEALTELKCPEKNEPFRKVKLRLFEKSQEQMNKRNIKKIDYATPLSQLKDIEDDNIDVFVELDDGYSYTVVISTPKNLLWYMDKEGLDYIPASPPDIIVRSLTEENIRKALESYIKDDAYWLKLYYLAGNKTDSFNIDTLNKALKEKRQLKEQIENPITKQKYHFIGYSNRNALYRDSETNTTFTPEMRIPTQEERMSVHVEPLYYLSIIWTDNLSIIKQIGCLKKLFPFMGISNQEILKIAKEKSEWTFANNISYGEAKSIYHRAKDLGIEIKVETMY